MHVYIFYATVCYLYFSGNLPILTVKAISAIVIMKSVFEKRFILYFMLWVFCIDVCVCTIFMPNSVKAKEGVGSPRIRVRDACEPS